ncbi:MAG: UDP-2,4-diacetamido-2,4,6-trideoxy-beta-L-altropyranose hydrolase [Bacteroidales bacterium]|nr:UDP-2,4-diacetamido-2,4,6-trideoxy-beta-L-altropyranose hydrolase [Bacteroidales bacterium]
MTYKQKILFRADAGPEIGYGHFIRSLALADMLKEDFDCVFYTQAPTDYQRKEAASICPLVELPADDTRFELFLNELTGKEIVVLDNYFYTTDYQKRIKETGCKLVCIDDMHDKHYVADVVVNHGNVQPEKFSIEPYTQLCLGLDFALLRRPFLEAAQRKFHNKTNPTIKRIAICFGGSDPMHLTEKALTALLPNNTIQHIDVIVGKYFSSASHFTDSRIHFHQSISAQTVADIFSNCDVAIVSASSVCVEALACGTTVAAGWYVDNQREGYLDLITKGWIIGMGQLCETDFSLALQKNTLESDFSLSNIRDNFIKAFKSLDNVQEI